MLAARSLIFNLLFYAWTVALSIAILPVLLMPPRATVAVARFWARSVAWLARVVVGLDWELRGREHLPDGPFVLAIKHQSAWDTIMYVLMVDEPAIVLKRELMWIPLYGWYLNKSGMIPIDRGAGGAALRKMLRRCRAALDAGRPIVIAPEGTRTAPGTSAPYHPGVAALYSHLDVPVVPAALNAGLYWGRRSFLRRPGRITVAFLEPMPAGLDRAAFMADLKERIETATAELQQEAGDRDGLAPTLETSRQESA